MGSIYKCKCNECSHDFTVYDGDGIRFIGLICNTCGNRSSIPRHAPRPPREGRDVPSFLQTSSYFSLPPIPDAEIKRFTDAEFSNIDQLIKDVGAFSSDRWDDFEIAGLLALRNPCKCGGIVDIAANSIKIDAPNALTRCPACRSEQITSTETGAWD